MITLKQVKNSYIIKKSEFITLSGTLNSKQDFDQIYADVKKKYPNARHIAYAYILNKDTFKYYDDGEPSGTAGKPIWSVMSKNDVIYSYAIVIRYFGGIKLGAGGLIRGYAKGIKDIINLKEFDNYILKRNYVATFDISFYNKNIRNFEHDFVINTTFTNKVQVNFLLSDTEFNNYPLKELLKLEEK